MLIYERDQRGRAEGFRFGVVMLKPVVARLPIVVKEISGKASWYVGDGERGSINS